MITMDVSATVSKQGADVSSATGDPPPTSEKIINTHVRSPSGDPVIIGGLIQQEKDESLSRLPLLGSIPKIGRFFGQGKTSMENTELVIYIVPHLEYPDEYYTSLDDRLWDLYTSHVEGNEWQPRQ